MDFDWSLAISQLNNVTVFDYFKNRSMPEFVEPLVSEIVSSFGSSPEADRLQLLSLMSSRASSILGWYARKLSGRAVRNRSQKDLKDALIAVAIAASKMDFRDLLAPLALLYNSAMELGENPELIFASASELSTPPIKEFFRSFLNRPQNLKSISIFGFSKGMGPCGFDYIPLLPEYGGPVPFDS
jgi:hypothetical protein